MNTPTWCTVRLMALPPRARAGAFFVLLVPLVVLTFGAALVGNLQRFAAQLCADWRREWRAVIATSRAAWARLRWGR